MMQFAWPWAFAFLIAPILMWLLLPRVKAKESSALRVPFFQEWTNAGGVREIRGSVDPVNLVLALIAWCMVVTAFARPQWVGDPVQIPLTGRDLMLAVDTSGSMERPDFEIQGQMVDRLTAVKSIAGDFIERRIGDRIGLILFGYRAYLQTPLTFDRTTVRTMLNESEIGLAGKETAIGDAIGLAIKRLQQRPENSRVLILLTDGANTAGEVEPLQAANLAKEAGLRIHTIGIGAERMQIQGMFGMQTVNPSADLDEKTLRTIASATGGSYFRATDTEALEKIYFTIDRIEPVKSDVRIFRPIDELYYWPFSIGLLALVFIGFRLRWFAFPMMRGIKHD